MSQKPKSQKELDDSILSEILGVQPTIAGIQLRPITLASIALLKQVESPLIEGKPFEEIQNIILDCCIFLKIQSSDVKAATKLAFGDYDVLVSESLELAERIEPNKIKEVVQSIVDLLSDQTSTKVNVVPDDNSSNSSEDTEGLLKLLTGEDGKKEESDTVVPSEGN
jgi:hypothetical protein